VRKGKTPVLLADEARQLLDSIDVSTNIGLRDRALIALLVYSFARISAALQMDVEDYYPQGKRWWVRLHEKGGKQHEMPAHHLLEQYLDAYVTAAGLTTEKSTPLFRTLGGRGRKQLTGDRMTRQDARRMIVRRAKKAGLLTRLGCHSFRATGITVYLLNGGLLEYAQQMAAHESARTTKLYDRRNDQVTLDPRQAQRFAEQQGSTPGCSGRKLPLCRTSMHRLIETVGTPPRGACACATFWTSVVPPGSCFPRPIYHTFGQPCVGSFRAPGICRPSGRCSTRPATVTSTGNSPPGRSRRRFSTNMAGNGSPPSTAASPASTSQNWRPPALGAGPAIAV
jgi:hypothetical protein